MQNNQSKSKGNAPSGNKPKDGKNTNFRKSTAAKKDRRNDKPRGAGKATTPVKAARKEAKNAAKRQKELNPNLLIKRAAQVVEETVKIETTFAEMNVHAGILSNLRNMGFVNPTEIQLKSFQALSEGENLIGIANTGTGKTGAFLIPILHRLLQEDRKFLTMVIVPTRELALQVYDEFKKLTVGMKFNAACFIGGTNIEKDLRVLKNPYDIVIATPGRLLDLKDRGGIKLVNFEVLILDEFDKMLDMGFVKDIRYIVDLMRHRKQTLLFSATKDPKQAPIIDEIVKDPVLVQVSSGQTSSENVDQDIIRVPVGEDKVRMLITLLRSGGFDKVIIFTETKHGANRLSTKLNSAGIKSDQIHGNKSQNYRVNALDKFKKGEITVLVATDVAARGIDVNDVTHVINYQVPGDYDTYIHRIGRTGRAGKTGKAFTFVDEKPVGE